MSEIRVLATVIAKKNEIEYVKSAALSMVALSHQDDGCLLYELHQCPNNLNTFVFFEIWADQKSLDKHNDTNHLSEFVACVKDRVELLEIKLLKKIA